MNTDSRRLFGRRVASLRQLRLMSQDKLAKLAGVSQKTVSNIERYGHGDPQVEFTLQSAESVAKVLGYEVWQLLLPIQDSLELPEPDVAGFRRMVTSLDRLISRYAQATAEGQRYIDSIAEREARYVVDDEIDPNLPSSGLSAARRRRSQYGERHE